MTTPAPRAIPCETPGCPRAHVVAVPGDVAFVVFHASDLPAEPPAELELVRLPSGDFAWLRRVGRAS